MTPFSRHPAYFQVKAVRGFTLIELLVVLTLLSLLMTGLISAMRTMAQTEAKIDQRLERLDEMRTTYAFLSQTLGALSVARLDVPGIPGKTMVPFVATPKSLTWVGILPVRPSVGGRHYFRLAIESFDTGDALALLVAPCDENMTPPNWSTAERHMLTPQIKQLTVYAQGSPPQGHEKESTWPQGWQIGWPIGDALPEQVRLSLQGPADAWPQEWTFALHALPRTDDSISIVTFGGGYRP